MSALLPFLTAFATNFASNALVPAAPAAPAQGSPSPYDYQDADQDQPMMVMPAQMMGGYGSPAQGSPALPVDMSEYIFGTPGFTSPPPAVFGDPAMGGVVDWVRGQVGTVAQTVGVGSAAAANANKKLIMENRTQINSNRGQIGSLKNNIAQLRRTLTTKAQEADKKKWLDALLAVSQALPGIRAYNVTHSEQARDRDEHLEDLASAIEDISVTTTAITHGSVTAFAAAYSDANANAILTQITDQISTLTARLNDVLSDLDSLKGKGEALAKSQSDYRKTISPGDLVSVARLVPSQLEKTDQAVIEVIGKSVLGAAPNTGGTFGLSLSI